LAIVRGHFLGVRRAEAVEAPPRASPRFSRPTSRLGDQRVRRQAPRWPSDASSSPAGTSTSELALNRQPNASPHVIEERSQ
jgi:hypothetical protein